VEGAADRPGVYKALMVRMLVHKNQLTKIRMYGSRGIGTRNGIATVCGAGEVE